MVLVLMFYQWMAELDHLALLQRRMERSKLVGGQEQKGQNKRQNNLQNLHFSLLSYSVSPHFISIYLKQNQKKHMLNSTPILWLAVNYVTLTVCKYCNVLVKLYAVLRNSYITALEVSRMGVAATVAAQCDCGARTELIHWNK